MKKSTAFVFCFLLLKISICSAQMRLIKRILSNDSDTSRKTSVIALPAAAYSQETGLEFGGISIVSFYTDKADTTTRSSTINGIVTFTTKKQSNFVLKPDIWTSGNKYHIAGTLRSDSDPGIVRYSILSLSGHFPAGVADKTEDSGHIIPEMWTETLKPFFYLNY